MLYRVNLSPKVSTPQSNNCFHTCVKRTISITILQVRTSSWLRVLEINNRTMRFLSIVASQLRRMIIDRLMTPSSIKACFKISCMPQAMKAMPMLKITTTMGLMVQRRNHHSPPTNKISHLAPRRSNHRPPTRLRYIWEMSLTISSKWKRRKKSSFLKIAFNRAVTPSIRLTYKSMRHKDSKMRG